MSSESVKSLGIGKTITNIDLDIQEIYEAEKFQPRPSSKTRCFFTRGSNGSSKKSTQDLRYKISYGDSFTRPLTSLKAPSQKSLISNSSSIHLNNIKLKNYQELKGVRQLSKHKTIS